MSPTIDYDNFLRTWESLIEDGYGEGIDWAVLEGRVRNIACMAYEAGTIEGFNRGDYQSGLEHGIKLGAKWENDFIVARLKALKAEKYAIKNGGQFPNDCI